MSKLACHGHNFKKGSVGGMDRHNRRLGEKHSNKEIDNSRSHLNLTYKHTHNLYQDCKMEVERVKANGGRLRSDQNWVTEFITYAPQEPMPQEEYKRYFQVVYDFFKERIGEENIKLAVVHMDERTPHMHLDFMPLVRDEHGEPLRLSSKEVIRRGFLYGIQEDLPKVLQAHGFNIQRGDKVTVEDRPLKGRPAYKYKADMEREKQKLQQDIQKLKALDKELTDRVRQGYEYVKACDKAREDYPRMRAEIGKLEEKKGELENSVKTLENRLTEASNQLLGVLDTLELMQNQKFTLSTQLDNLERGVKNIISLRDELADLLNRKAHGMGIGFKQTTDGYVLDIKRHIQKTRDTLQKMPGAPKRKRDNDSR